MDVRQYYKKIREVKAEIEDSFVFVTSLETSDGGRAGVVSEVTRDLAARLIVEGCAARSTAKEIEAFKKKQQEVRKAAERSEFSKSIHLAVIREPDQTAPDAKSGDK